MMKLNPKRVIFVSCILAMMSSLFMGAVALLYRWPIIVVLIFTFMFAIFLVMAVYIYVSFTRQSEYEKLRAQMDELEMSTEEKLNFFAELAHEIRTPINAIMGYDELILREYNDPALRQYAGNIKIAANTLLHLVNDSLDMSRIEAGKIKLFPIEYDLGFLIEELISMAQPRAQSKGLELKSYVNDQIPRYLYGDSDRIKQCVMNILTNAVKYTEEGEIIFSVDYDTVEEDREDGKTEILLHVSVRDTGIGIKEEDLERLYRPYERINEEKIRTIEGTGLGITIVRLILELMESELEVESVYGEGSNFHFTIKQEVMRMDPIGDIDQIYAENVLEKNTYHNKFVAPDARILIVDDGEMNLSVMEGLLKATKIQIDTVLSASTGLEFAEKNDYDLIMIDMRMPGMNGEEMIKCLRGEDKTKGKTKKNVNTPCIALTAGSLQEVQSEYIKIGFADYLLKPIAYKELEMVLMQYLPEEKVKLTARRRTDEPLLMTEEKYDEAVNILTRRQNVSIGGTT